MLLADGSTVNGVQRLLTSFDLTGYFPGPFETISEAYMTTKLERLSPWGNHRLVVKHRRKILL